MLVLTQPALVERRSRLAAYDAPYDEFDTVRSRLCGLLVEAEGVLRETAAESWLTRHVTALVDTVLRLGAAESAG